MLKRVFAHPNAAGSLFRVELSKLQKVSPSGVSYLRRWALFNDMTTTVSNGGQAVTPIQLHDMLADVQCKGGGETWGPQNLSGAELAALFAVLTGHPPGGNVSAESDENIADNAGAVERQILEVFPYDLVGQEPGDFSPPVGFLAEIGTALEVQQSALVTNQTAFGGTTSVYADTEEVPELRAVPPLRAAMLGVNALTNGSLPGGRMHALLLKRSSDLTDSLVDLFQLAADGVPVVDAGDPSWINQLIPGDRNANAAAANSQESGFDSLSGTRPRFMQLYPERRYADDRRLTKRATANQFTFNLTSTLTASQFEFLQLVSSRLTPSGIVDQTAPCGVSSRAEIIDAITKDPAGVMRPKTSSKAPTIADQYQGWLPVKVRVPGNRFGLRGR